MKGKGGVCGVVECCLMCEVLMLIDVKEPRRAGIDAKSEIPGVGILSGFEVWKVVVQWQS